MDFTIEKDKLLSALTTLSKINPARTTLPILSTVLIKTEQTGNVVFRTTDLEVEMKITVESKVLEEGETCAPIYKPLEISNTLSEETVSINVNETQRMRIKTSTGKYLLMCNKTAESPSTKYISLCAGSFSEQSASFPGRALISRTLFLLISSLAFFAASLAFAAYSAFVIIFFATSGFCSKKLAAIIQCAVSKQIPNGKST